MRTNKTNVRLSSALLGMVVGVGCAGYLEEQAWLSDGGRGYVVPADAGVAPALPPPPTAAGGAPAVQPSTGTGSGGATGAGSSPGVQEGPKPVDAATPPPAPPPDAGAPLAMVRECATGPQIIEKILKPKCVKCHSTANPMRGLDLEAPNSKMRLINVAAKCAGKTLVTADGEVGGHLFDKLSGAVTGCGARMPAGAGAVPLSAEEISCLKDWIKPPPPPPPAGEAPPCSSLAEINAKILVPKCGMCHGAKAPPNVGDLISPGAKARLVGIKAKCMTDKDLITASGEVSGLFFDKLVGPVLGCGNQMPFGGSPLSPAEIKCLKDWIRPSP